MRGAATFSPTFVLEPADKLEGRAVHLEFENEPTKTQTSQFHLRPPGAGGGVKPITPSCQQKKSFKDTLPWANEASNRPQDKSSVIGPGSRYYSSGYYPNSVIGSRSAQGGAPRGASKQLGGAPVAGLTLRMT